MNSRVPRLFPHFRRRRGLNLSAGICAGDDHTHLKENKALPPRQLALAKLKKKTPKSLIDPKFGRAANQISRLRKTTTKKVPILLFLVSFFSFVLVMLLLSVRHRPGLHAIPSAILCGHMIRRPRVRDLKKRESFRQMLFLNNTKTPFSARVLGRAIGLCFLSMLRGTDKCGAH